MLLYCRFYSACVFCLNWVWFGFMTIVLFMFFREPDGVSNHDDTLSQGTGFAKAWSRSLLHSINNVNASLRVEDSSSVVFGAFLIFFFLLLFLFCWWGPFPLPFSTLPLPRLWGFNLERKSILKFSSVYIDLLKVSKSDFIWWETAEQQLADIACTRVQFRKTSGCSLPLGKRFPVTGRREMPFPTLWC